jgi:hypothetical protein
MTVHSTQAVKDKETLYELDDNAIENICKAVRKDTGQSVSKLATTRLKLLCVWIKHQDRTSRAGGVTAKPHVRNTINMVNMLRMQKHDEDA